MAYDEMVPKFLVLDTEPFAVLGADGNAGECTHAVFAVAFWERGRINFRDLPLSVGWLMLRTDPRSAQMPTAKRKYTNDCFDVCGAWLLNIFWL